jgi:hypothetical protein
MQKKSFTGMVNALKDKTQAEKVDVFDHCIFSLEVDDNGNPTGKMASVKGSTMTVLGMLDALKEAIEDARAEVYVKLERAEAMSQNLRKSASKEVFEKLKNFEIAVRKAIAEDNIEEVLRLKKEADDLLKMSGLDADFGIKTDENDDDDDKKDSSEFDINDFKGSF